MALICLIKRLRLKCREIVEVANLMPKLQEIDLKEIPHFTTLQKFFKRFKQHDTTQKRVNGKYMLNMQFLFSKPKYHRRCWHKL